MEISRKKSCGLSTEQARFGTKGKVRGRNSLRQYSRQPAPILTSDNETGHQLVGV